MNEEIVIVVEGGVVQEVYNNPPHVTVRVKDYDVDGVGVAPAAFCPHVVTSCIEC